MDETKSKIAESTGLRFSPEDAPPLLVEELTFAYGNLQVLSGLSLRLQAGDLALLSGPNGAGKTTLLNCLTGLLRAREGLVSIGGHDLWKDEQSAKRELAFVPDVPRFYTELTAWEHLRFVALAHGMGEEYAPEAERLLRDFGLWEARDLYPHHYSRGMRLKLGIVMALLRPFRVLLLDEPTSALDAEGVETLLSVLQESSAEGAAVLMSTHDAALAARLSAPRLLRLEQGRLVEG